MTTQLQNLHIMLQNLLSREEGQDLVEYALIVALLSLAAVAAMQGLAGGIAATFTGITSTLTTATS